MGELKAGLNGARMRILAVDDEPRLLATLVALLEGAGYVVESASGGVRAQEMLERRHYDVALLDLMMPDLNGISVMKRLAEREIDTRVIVVSGDHSIESAIAALRYGAFDFVRKPYAPEVLLHAVGNAVRQRELERDGRQARTRLERSERLHRYMVEHSPDLIYVLDADGRLRFVNRRLEERLGYAKSELLGRPFTTLLFPEEHEALRQALAQRRRAGDRTVELRLRAKEGEPVFVDNGFFPLELETWSIAAGEGEASGVGVYGVARDVTERKRAEETIRFQAHHDLLTRLPNRALFKEHLTHALAHAKRIGEGLAVLYLDIDRFKVVNDQLGHVAGDQLLCALSDRLRGLLRQEDTVARLAGDEFAVLAAGIEGAGDAERVAAKIIDALKSPFHLAGHELYIGVSIGISLHPDHGDSVEELLKNADIALYHGRGQAKGSYRLYDDHMDGTFSRHLVIERGIRTALDSGQFEVHFQPQIAAGAGGIVGVEALLRWQHPELGAISPAEFVPVAEETGLIVPLGDWVLHRAVRELARWRDEGFTNVRLAINFSAVQMAQPDFVDKVVAALEGEGLPGECLEVEITENVLMNDMDAVAGKLNALTAHGISIAIDDFGTGYSSLSYLQNLPIHRIKIDRSFVRVIEGETAESSIVNAIVAMAGGLGMGVVAEGVETDQQRDYLARIGCNELQGFLFSKAVASEAVTELLSRAGLGPGLRAG